jgi:DNA-binding response OmpR family regulator
MTIRKAVRMTLEFENYEIHVAGDGTDRLRMAKEPSTELGSLDIMMPGAMDGLQFCQAIRSQPELAPVKVGMLTGRGQVRDPESGKTVGADAYLVKPFSPLELIRTLEQLTAPL